MRWLRAAAVLLLGYLALRFFWPLLYPLLLTTLLTIAIEKPVAAFSRLGLSRALSCFLVLFTATATCGLLLVLLLHGLWQEGRELALALPSLYQTALASMNALQGWIPSLNPEERHVLETLLGWGLAAMGRALAAFAQAAAGVPSFLFATGLSLLATYFASRDRDLLRHAFQRTLPARARREIERMWAIGAESLRGYLRAQCTLAALTGLVAGSMLFLFGSPYALLWGLLCALLDLVPVVGPAGLLVPWACAALLMGNAGEAIRLVGLLAALMVLRQVLEPRTVGSQIGVHPVTALAAVYIGLSWLGPIGLIAGPLLVAVAAATLRSEHET